MGWESDQEQFVEKEPRDWSRYLLPGVLVLLGIMGLFMLITPKFASPLTRVHAKHILIKIDRTDPASQAEALKTAQQIHEWLMEGQDFEKLAKEWSQDEQTNRKGGDLGWLTKGKLEGQFEEYVWIAEVGNISDVLLTSYGYHIVVVVERQVTKSEQYEQDLNNRVNQQN